MMPGPSSTDNGFPVRKTGSPTVTPAEMFKINIFQFNKILTYMFLRKLE